MATEDDPLIPENGTPTRNRRPAVFAIVFAGGALALLVAVWCLLPSFPHPQVDNRAKSASNLRQIGQAILLYANDEAGAYPDSFHTLLLHGNITSDVFVSWMSSDTPAAGPTTQAVADQLDAGGHLSYVYLGQRLTAKTVTDSTVVAYEKLSIFGTGANVLFGDNHVEFDDAKSVTQIIDKSTSGKFPVTMP